MSRPGSWSWTPLLSPSWTEAVTTVAGGGCGIGGHGMILPRPKARYPVNTLRGAMIRPHEKDPRKHGGQALCGKEDRKMPAQIAIGPVHHLRLTVTDIGRSRAFYTSLLGFDVAVESPPADDPSAEAVGKILFGGVVLVRGDLLLGLRPVASLGDRFDADRVGLDHLSFGVASRDELEAAVRLFDEQGVPHGEIATLASFGIHVLPFRDPDNIQIELTAPVA